MRKKTESPMVYYEKIIEFLARYFSGVHFQFKLHKKHENSEDYLDPSKNKSFFGKLMRKGGKWIRKNVFCGLGLEDEVSRFVNASD